jgi:hypothetical protein
MSYMKFLQGTLDSPENQKNCAHRGKNRRMKILQNLYGIPLDQTSPTGFNSFNSGNLALLLNGCDEISPLHFSNLDKC